MRVRLMSALRFFCLAGLTVGFAFPATAQWRAPPWRFAPPPAEIEWNLNAQGYVLAAPLMRRPGLYLADVSAGPGGYQRLIIDARSGRILERFPAPGRIWGPALASRGDAFGGPPPSWMGRPRNGEFSDAPRPARAAKPAHGAADIHIPEAVRPYDAGEAPPRPKSASTTHGPRATKPAAPTMNPPLPPPAPRETAKADGSDPAAPGSSAEARDRPKVTIVPPALFE
jgi:hypothetical protein